MTQLQSQQQPLQSYEFLELYPNSYPRQTTQENEQAWEAWKAKGRGTSRPPWWLLLFGILALGVVYWLWGGAPR